MKRIKIIILAVLACFAISNARPTTVHHTHNSKQTLKTAQGLFLDYPQYTSIYSEWDYLTVQQTAFYQQMAVTVFDATGIHILCTVIEETGKVPVKEYAKNLANAWRPQQQNGQYIFVFRFVEEDYTYIEISENVKNFITEKTLDSLKANVYEPKLNTPDTAQQTRTGTCTKRESPPQSARDQQSAFFAWQTGNSTKSTATSEAQRLQKFGLNPRILSNFSNFFQRQFACQPA